MSVRPLPVAVALAASVLALALSACGQSATSASNAANPSELVLAAVPQENAQQMLQSYQPVLDMLTKELGKPVRFQTATDYAAVIEAQRAGKVQIAVYGPLSYVVARNSGVHTTSVAAQVLTKGGTSGYHSDAVVPAGSPIHDLASVRGHKVCFVDPNSTSGFLYPRAGLVSARLNPDKDVTAVMTGGHDASALAVASGQCDAAFVSDLILATMVRKGQLRAGQLTPLWQSDLIPANPVAVSDDLDPVLKTKIADVFRDKANVDYLNANGFCGTSRCTGADDTGDWGYTPAGDSFYTSVRTVCATTKAKQCTAS